MHLNFLVITVDFKSHSSLLMHMTLIIEVKISLNSEKVGNRMIMIRVSTTILYRRPKVVWHLVLVGEDSHSWVQVRVYLGSYQLPEKNYTVDEKSVGSDRIS